MLDVLMQIIVSGFFSMVVFGALIGFRVFVNDFKLTGRAIEKVVCSCINVTFFSAITTTCGLVLKLMILFTLS